jgi:hypothetical protein
MQTSKKIEFNSPQPTGMKDAGIVRGVHFNKVIDDISELYSKRIAGTIIATSTSTTTNFSSLMVGDIIVVVPVAAGTPANTTGTYFLTCATVGTLPAAAVVGSLYIVIRSNG